jgi:hypothetical protein
LKGLVGDEFEFFVTKDGIGIEIEIGLEMLRM